jgi:flagellar biosynthesis regulator FlaF
MCILVNMLNVIKVHVSAVKTNGKKIKNTCDTVYFTYKVWYMCVLENMWNVLKVHVSAVKTHEKICKTVHQWMWNVPKGHFSVVKT